MIPPRANTMIPPSALGAYEGRDWRGTAKKNGTNNVIVVSPSKEITAHNRQGEPHKLWKVSEQNTTIFRRLPGTGYWVLNTELIHSKVVGMRDINYVHDVLVADGKELWGTTYEERQKILIKTFSAVSEFSRLKMELSHVAVDNYTWLAINHTSDFRELYTMLDGPDDEGLVLKRASGRLGVRDSSGAPWMVKCRRTNKNVSF
jgi:hypothetical protein